jgi:glucan phosphorylase
LDTRLEQNDPADRAITDRLYNGDEANRLNQEIVLGVGGERLLQALSFDIETYQHTASQEKGEASVHCCRQRSRVRITVVV